MAATVPETIHCRPCEAGAAQLFITCLPARLPQSVALPIYSLHFNEQFRRSAQNDGKRDGWRQPCLKT